MAERRELLKTEGQTIERTSERPAVAPAVDVYENEDEVLIVADIPGVRSEGLNLRFDNDLLTIEATTAPSPVEGTPMFKEFRDVDYRRTFQLAPGIDGGKITAEIATGTLRVHLPKSSAIKPRRIPITKG